MAIRLRKTAALLAVGGSLLAGVALAPAANAATGDATTAPTVTISDGVTSVQRGDTVRFEITVQNESNEFQGYAVGAQLPAGFTAKRVAFAADSGLVPAGYVSGSNVDGWVNLAPGETKTIAFDATVTSTAPTGTATSKAYAVSQYSAGAQLGFATPDVDQVQ